ncbi:HD domain-containing protein [Streptomyces lancefieldiae]|uniref:HD domain-containing protein n=1 Tax=Streptomyces lancefieldiae TaxID=3075520 RepID=A0ABU3AWG2_9ACTN|nr:HD domain-containing protein [Streptomyces sp. DSM 40712]MDT0614354.1 HD domain-containing protein [Streptomyces sp. DSM 40712]
MSERANEAKSISRRTALERGAGVAAIGAASAVAAAWSSPPAHATVSSKAQGTTLPTVVAGVRIPDSELARSATAFARKVSSEPLFNHVMRTYVYGSLLFDRRGVRYDRELAFTAAVLHDLGLVKAYQSPDERFEVDGADAARNFLRERRMPAERVAVVWDAIALHTNVGIATRKRPEIGIVSVGSGLDFTGNDLQQIPSDALAEILTVFPRAGFKREALDTILSLCRTKPMSVLMHPFAEVGRRHLPDFPVPTVEDLLLAAPFEE